ncbi:MAG TPA: hypothetical protein VFK88_10325 [Gallionella sp.]|nr:hypothetical protein [Gallionella sp.]
MAIQQLSNEEVGVVAGGLVLLGLDVGAVLASLVNQVLPIVATALTVVDSTVASAGVLVGNVLVSVNNTIVGLGL